MTVTKEQNVQAVEQSALPILGVAARTDDETIFLTLEKHLDTPSRMYANLPADTNLYFSTSLIEVGDGAGKSLPPIDDKLVTSVAGLINYQTISSPVSGITLTLAGGTYAHPTATVGQCVIGAFVRKGDGSYDCKYSTPTTQSATLALDVAQTLFSTLDGLPVGYIYLTCTNATGLWKTMGSTTSIIENKTTVTNTIVRFGAGGGSGGAGDRSFKLSLIVSNVATIKSGYMLLEDGRELVTYDGSNPEGTVDVALNLKTGTNSAGVTSPANSTTYWLYIDLQSLPSVTTLANGRSAFRVASGTSGPFTVLVDSPTSGLVSLARYVPIATLITDGSGNYVSSTTEDFAHRLAPNLSPLVDGSFKLLSVVSNVAVIKGGFLMTDRGEEIATVSGGVYGVDLSFNLKSAVHTDGIVAPGSSQTGLYLYLDLVRALAPASAANLPDNGRKVYGVASGTTGSFIILQTNPDVTDTSRYMPIACLETDGSSNYVFRTTDNVATRYYSAPVERVGNPIASTSTVLKLRGGYIELDDNRVLSSGTSTSTLNAGGDLTLTVANILSNSGISLAGATLYTLVIDLNTLPTAPNTLDNGRTVYPWLEANLKLFTTAPEAIDPRRYVYLCQIRTATATTTFANATFINKPARVHDTLAAYFPYAENYALQITSGTGIQTLTHNLTGEPQVVLAYYYDLTNKYLVEDNVIVSKSSTQIKVNVDAYDVTGGRYIEVQAIYVPGMKAVAGSSRTFTSAWFQSTATTTLPHGLNDSDDIRGYEVQEWDVTADKIRNIDRSALVVNFDDVNFNLNWTGLVPSATLKYRVVAGGSPLPWAVPSDLGGFTKYVKKGPGSFATVVSALAGAAAGDKVLIFGSTIETANIVVPAGVELVQQPGTTVTMSGTFNVQFSGAKGVWKGMNVQYVPTGTLASAVSISAADCIAEGWLEFAPGSALTATAMVVVTSLGLRASYALSVLRTLGTITALEDNQDGAGNARIWGG
jgi:hypothetical protein